MNSRQRIKIHHIIEYIRHFDFEFDLHDLEDGIDNILQYYDIFQVFTDEEYHLLTAELLVIAGESQINEIVRLVQEQESLFL